MKETKENGKTLLTREEAKKVLGGKVDGNDPNRCPDGTYEYTCFWGTNWRKYCVDNAFNPPDCSNPYPGWSDGNGGTGGPGVGVPGPVNPS